MGHSARPMIHIIDPHTSSLLQQNEYATAEHIHQRAKKVVSNSLGLVDFAIGLVNTIIFNV